MKIHQLFSLLIRSGVVVEMETNEFFLNMPAIAPWARKALDDLSTCENEPGVQLRRSFELHKRKWQRETCNLSGGAETHESYRAIIALGKNVLPYIFASLEFEADWWFAALSEITGENPVKRKDRGKLAAMSSAWLRWGRDHGYLR